MSIALHCIFSGELKAVDKFQPTYHKIHSKTPIPSVTMLYYDYTVTGQSLLLTAGITVTGNGSVVTMLPAVSNATVTTLCLVGD